MVSGSGSNKDGRKKKKSRAVRGVGTKWAQSPGEKLVTSFEPFFFLSCLTFCELITVVETGNESVYIFSC